MTEQDKLLKAIERIKKINQAAKKLGEQLKKERETERKKPPAAKGSDAKAARDL